MGTRNEKQSGETYPLPSVFCAKYSIFFKIAAAVSNLFVLSLWYLTSVILSDKTTLASTKAFFVFLGLAFTFLIIVRDLDIVAVLQEKQYFEISGTCLRIKNRSKEITINYDEVRSYEIIDTGRTRFLRIDGRKEGTGRTDVSIKVGLLQKYFTYI